MDKAALSTMRNCLRTGKNLRCQATSSASKCIATKICAARNVMTSSNPTPRPLSTSKPSSATPTALRTRLLLQDRTLKRYSTSESSIQGTIGSGEGGIPAEAAREQEILEAPEHLNEKERQIWEMLMKELQCTKLEVQDISGGCGSMYGIDIVSERFRGISMLKQQRLVNEVLGEEIKGWHGVQLKTRAP